MFVSRYLPWVIWSIVNTQQQRFTATLYAQVVSLNGLSSLETEQARLRVYGTQISNLQETLALRKTLQEFKRERTNAQATISRFTTQSQLYSLILRFYCPFRTTKGSAPLPHTSTNSFIWQVFTVRCQYHSSQSTPVCPGTLSPGNIGTNCLPIP